MIVTRGKRHEVAVNGDDVVERYTKKFKNYWPYRCRWSNAAGFLHDMLTIYLQKSALKKVLKCHLKWYRNWGKTLT